MLFKIVLLLTFVSVFHCNNYCSDYRTLNVLKRSTYEFSVKLLDSVIQDTKGDDFVISPLTTWLQLTSIAEGARNRTLKQIVRVTKHSTLQCLKRRWKRIINNMDLALKRDLTLRNIIIIDKLLNVKPNFLKHVEKLQNIDVLLYNFNDMEKVANETNNFIESETGGRIQNIVYPEYFYSTLLVSVGAVYYKNKWQSTFIKQYTTEKDFYSFHGSKLGVVNMMKQTGFFNMTYMPIIKSNVLELPCENGRISMLIFKPKELRHFMNFFYALKRIELKSVYTMFRKSGMKYVNVELPRFKMNYEFDNIPELIFDMGARRMFNPRAEFQGISDYTIFASMMTQVSSIEVTEEGVEARSIAENLVHNDEPILDFIVNKPFVYMLVDKEVELILFAGIYSKPSQYE